MIKWEHKNNNDEKHYKENTINKITLIIILAIGIMYSVID